LSHKPSDGSGTVDFDAYRRIALYEMPDDMKIGLNLAFYRSFAIEPIGELLRQTGEITGHTRKRADDTGVFMYLLIYHGFDHPDGEAAIRRLTRMHRRYAIANEHYLYVLACLIVVPTRWIARYGPRPLREDELDATMRFYRALGQHMDVIDIPTTYGEVAAWLDAYDEEYLRPSSAGMELMGASRSLLVDRFPSWAKPVVGKLSDAMLDRPLRQALGIRDPGWGTRVILSSVMRVRACAARRRPARSEPSFTPDGPVRSYPDGYTIDELGPADLDP
jgi:hypothetical protein